MDLDIEWFGHDRVTSVTRFWRNGKLVWHSGMSEPAPLFLDEQPRVYGRVRTQGRVVWPATSTAVSPTSAFAPVVALAVIPFAWIVARRQRLAAEG